MVYILCRLGTMVILETVFGIRNFILPYLRDLVSMISCYCVLIFRVIHVYSINIYRYRCVRYNLVFSFYCLGTRVIVWIVLVILNHCRSCSRPYRLDSTIGRYLGSIILFSKWEILIYSFHFCQISRSGKNECIRTCFKFTSKIKTWYYLGSLLHSL